MSALAIIQAQLDTERAQNSEQALALAHAQAEITALKAELAAWQDAWQEKSPYIGSSEFLAPAIAGAAAEAEGLALALALAPVPPAPPIGLGGSVYHVESTRRLWCQSPKPEYDLPTQRYGMPARCIPLMRPQLDLIVLPGAHAPTLEAWCFYKAVLGLTDDQVIWTAGSKFNMDDNMDESTVETLVNRMESVSVPGQTTWLLVPYCPTPNFLRWASPLVENSGGLLTIFGESSEWLAKYGDKGGLHRKMSSLHEPSVLETIDPTIAVPRGFVCETVEELLAARELMSDLPEVCIKPLSGATGEGIVLKPTLEFLKEYNFHMGAVNLEHCLNLDLDDRGEAISPVLHYMGNKFCGDYMLDQIMDGCTYTGWSRTAVSQEFQDESARVMTAYLEYSQPNGAGGVDFLSVDGKPLLTDINTGRFNGAHPAKLFHEAHAPPGSEFYCWKLSAAQMEEMNGVGMMELWEALLEAGLGFSPASASASASASAQAGDFNARCSVSSGVFPLISLRGLRYQFLVIGENQTETMALVHRAKEVLARVRPVVPESPVLMAMEANPASIEQLMLELAEAVMESLPDQYDDESQCAWDVHKLIRTPRDEQLEVELPKAARQEMIVSALEGVLEMQTAEAVLANEADEAEANSGSNVTNVAELYTTKAKAIGAANDAIDRQTAKEKLEAEEKEKEAEGKINPSASASASDSASASASDSASASASSRQERP